LIWVSFWD